MRILFTTCLLLAGLGASAEAAESPKAGRRQFTERMEGARTEVYKRIGNTNLVVHIFEPSGPAKTNRAASVAVGLAVHRGNSSNSADTLAHAAWWPSPPTTASTPATESSR